jgi:opacity protein-like surface antigen
MHAESPAARPARPSIRNLLRHFIVLAAGLLLAATPAIAQEQVDVQDDDPFDRAGFYFGLGGVYQNNPFENQIEDAIDDELDDIIVGTSTLQISGFSLDIDDSGGINALVGYRAASFFAAEIEYEWIDDYDVEVSGTGTFVSGPLAGTSLSASGDLYNIEGHTLTLNTKWIVPFWRIQPYASVGGGLGFYEVKRGSAADLIELLTNGDVDIEDGKETSLAGRFGIGIDWYVLENLLINTRATVVLTTQDFGTPDEDTVDDLNYLSFGAGLQYRF